MESMTQTCPLPEDILLDEIVPRLPARSVIRFKSVSKTWQSRISQYSSLLAAKHTAREEQPVTLIEGRNKTERENLRAIFSLGYGGSNVVEIDTSYLWKKTPKPNQSRLTLIGSCEGLVCLLLCYSFEERDVVLWNPATRQVNYLPAAAVDPCGCGESNARYFLGFDTQTGDHKVVRVEPYRTEDDAWGAKAQIFSRKRGSWRELKSGDAYIQEHAVVTIRRIICRRVTKSAIMFDACPVLSFDLSTEELREFEGARLETGMDSEYLDLLNRKGSLCAIWDGATTAQLWLKNGSNTGWKKISNSYHAWRPLGNRKDGKLACYKQFCQHFHTLVSPN